jgi:hypothetical protein
MAKTNLHQGDQMEAGMLSHADSWITERSPAHIALTSA